MAIKKDDVDEKRWMDGSFVIQGEDVVGGDVVVVQRLGRRCTQL